MKLVITFDLPDVDPDTLGGVDSLIPKYAVETALRHAESIATFVQMDVQGILSKRIEKPIILSVNATRDDVVYGIRP